MPPRAVIWDLDGTLVDSRAYHWRAWRETLAALGYSLTYEQFLATFGWRNEEILRQLLGPDLPEEAVARIAAAKERRYRELVQSEGLTLLPGARLWLERLHRAGWRQALATSAPRQNVETILAVLGISAYFQATVCAEDVQRGKPDPEIFLRAAARLGVPPARCVVVEDAPAGVEAARRAGMRVVGVLTSHPHLDADLVAPTLADLPPDAFDRLVPPDP
jgi:beta-phosphoglucomutase